MDLGEVVESHHMHHPVSASRKNLRLDSGRIHLPTSLRSVRDRLFSTKEGKQLIPNFLQVILAKVEFPNFGWT